MGDLLSPACTVDPKCALPCVLSNACFRHVLYTTVRCCSHMCALALGVLHVLSYVCSRDSYVCFHLCPVICVPHVCCCMFALICALSCLLYMFTALTCTALIFVLAYTYLCSVLSCMWCHPCALISVCFHALIPVLSSTRVQIVVFLFGVPCRDNSLRSGHGGVPTLCCQCRACDGFTH